MKSGTVLIIWLRFFADSLIASILASTDELLDPRGWQVWCLC